MENTISKSSNINFLSENQQYSLYPGVQTRSSCRSFDNSIAFMDKYTLDCIPAEVVFIQNNRETIGFAIAANFSSTSKIEIDHTIENIHNVLDILLMKVFSLIIINDCGVCITMEL